jgi:hypothetical protein
MRMIVNIPTIFYREWGAKQVKINIPIKIKKIYLKVFFINLFFSENINFASQNDKKTLSAERPKKIDVRVPKVEEETL